MACTKVKKTRSKYGVKVSKVAEGVAKKHKGEAPKQRKKKGAGSSAAKFGKPEPGLATEQLADKIKPVFPRQ